MRLHRQGAQVVWAFVGFEVPVVVTESEDEGDESGLRVRSQY